MKLYIVRHGQSTENVKKVLAGRTDSPLTELGVEQAKLAGNRLKDIDFAHMYSSRIKRCFDTAQQIIKYHKEAPFEFSDLLLEREFGIFTGKSVADIDYAAMDEETMDNKQNGVEWLSEVRERVKTFLSELEDRHESEDNILAVTHSNPLRIFVSEVLNIPYLEVIHTYPFANTAINIVEIKDGNYTPVAINDHSHLDQATE